VAPRGHPFCAIERLSSDEHACRKAAIGRGYALISFLLLTSFAGESVAVRLAQAVERLAAALPGHVFTAVETPNPAIGAVLIRESGGAFDAFVSAASREGRLVLAYGEADRPAGMPLAALLAERSVRDPVDAASVAGCFGAAFVAGEARDIHLVGDGLGQRCLRYTWLGDTVAASPHDLPLVAAGVGVHPRPLALAGLVRFGWSFGGASLLADVETVAAEEVHHLRRGGGEVLLHPSHRDAARRLASDVAATRSAILDDLIAYTRANHTPGTPLEVELSAGFDSRAVLTIALAAAPGDVETFTDGPPRSQDVRVAARLASVFGLPHRAGGTRGSTPSERLETIDTLAIATNGQATAMPTMTNKGASEDTGKQSLGGDGAEVFRGYYYPKAGNAAAAAYDPAAMAAFAMRKFSIGQPYLPEALEGELAAYVTERATRWSPLCRTNADGFDLLYLIERTGTWNQKLRRMHSRRGNPFYARSATYALLSLPGIRGRHARIHEALFHTHPLRARLIPLNGETVPALISGGAVPRALGRAGTLAAKVWWKLADRIVRGRAGTGSGDLEEMRSERFRAHLRNDWLPLFESAESVFRLTVGGEQAHTVLRRAAEGDRRAAEVLATMVVAERFFRIVRATAEPTH